MKILSIFVSYLTYPDFKQPICSIMRNLKTVQSITIRAQYSEEASYELVFEMALASNITRSHRFHYADCEILSAIFDETSASYLRCEPKVFTQLLDHFYHSPEICIEASQNFFHVKSFHQDSASDPFHGGSNDRHSAIKHMTTGLIVNTDEFDEYNYNFTNNEEDGNSIVTCEELVVCSKEVRAFLHRTLIF